MPEGPYATPPPQDWGRGFAEPGYRPQGRPAYTPHRGGMILAFGLLGLFFCFIFGIVAWSMGNTDLREMAAGRMDPAGRGLTDAGRILGMVSTLLVLLAGAGFLLFLVAGLAH